MTHKNTINSSLKVLKLFEEGKKLTEDLLKENERLRYSLAALRNEKKDLEKKYITVNIPHLQERVRLLEDEIAAAEQMPVTIQSLKAMPELAPGRMSGNPYSHLELLVDPCAFQLVGEW